MDRCISIIILTYNNLEYTRICIENIRKYTEKDTYEIIIVDNNSTDGTRKWLKQQNDIKFILNDENLGFPKGCNQGIELAQKENDILLLNNDTIVLPNWLYNLRSALYVSDDIGAVGPVTNNAAYYQAIKVDCRNFHEILDFSLKFNKKDSSKYEKRIKLVGFCMLIKREVVEKIGLLDERFNPGNFEDDDYCFRILNGGYKLLLCKDTFIYHFGSVSFKKEPGNYNNLLKVNKNKFVEKWGFDPWYSCFIRNDIIQFIEEAEDKEINVLEIGCGCGATLLKIKSIYKNANIFGIELNVHSADIAKNFVKITAENIEKAKLNYEPRFFDYIIFGDVLEHLQNPWNVLNSMKKYLKNTGCVIASVPNVMHYSIIKDLINGFWTYKDFGILDRTHLRFFTLKEINKMFEESGYKNIKCICNIISMSSEDEEFIKKICKLTDNPDLELQYKAYQYIIKAAVGVDKNNSESEKLKFLLRRIENNIDVDSSKNEIYKLVRSNNLNVDSIFECVDKNIIKKDYVLNLIALYFYEKKYYDELILIFQKAYEYNDKNSNVIYNLGTFLLELGEKELALKYLEKIEGIDEDIDNTISKLRSEF